jgi:hypothetical protein
VPDFARASNEGGFNARDAGIQVSRVIGLSSGDSGIKDYYLEYPDGSKDTLYVDYQHISFDAAKKNSCKCEYPMRPVKYNQQTSSLDSLTTQQPVYLFKKN